MNTTLGEKYQQALERILKAVNDTDMSQANRLELIGYLATDALPEHMPWEVLRPIENPDDPEVVLGMEPDDDCPAADEPAPFALVWYAQMGSLRRRDGFTVIATMSERTNKRIKQAKDDGADFYELKAMFPKKHSVYNA